MISLLKAIAIIYSAITLFLIELLYQFVMSLIKGTQYSISALKNAIIDSFFEISADLIMLIIDFIQSIIDGIMTGTNKARIIFSEFRQKTS